MGKFRDHSPRLKVGEQQIEERKLRPITFANSHLEGLKAPDLKENDKHKNKPVPSIEITDSKGAKISISAQALADMLPGTQTKDVTILKVENDKGYAWTVEKNSSQWMVDNQGRVYRGRSDTVGDRGEPVIGLNFKGQPCNGKGLPALPRAIIIN